MNDEIFFNLLVLSKKRRRKYLNHKNKDYLDDSYENSIFIVGLDFHTGYISKQKNDCFFIHSNYINQEGVTRENIQDSKALKSSKTWMIGSISANDNFIKNWINH